MIENLYIPPDNDLIRQKYEGLGGGTCGPSTIAILEKTTVQGIIDKWRVPWRGYSPISEVEDTLHMYCFDYTTKRCRGNKAKEFPTPKTPQAIVRVQWLKDDGTEYFWRAAGPHSHYVLMLFVPFSSGRVTTLEPNVDGRWFIFCNGEGWFEKGSDFAKKYLDGRGYISSYIELTKNQLVTSLTATGDTKGEEK